MRRLPQAIEQLHWLGVTLAMDDLDSGYSSLRRLSLLPFDIIKSGQSLSLQIRRLPVQMLSPSAAEVRPLTGFFAR